MFSYIKHFFTIFVLFICVCAIQANAATHEASSCSRADVLTAINAASNGDTVIIPAGTCQWDSQITLSKGITIRGAGIDSTTIERRGFTVSSGTDNWRITGITWDGEAQSVKPFQFSTCKNWRMDHCKIYDYSGQIMTIHGFSYGLIDNCEITDVGGETIVFYGDNATAWTRSQDFTSTASADRFTNGTLYIEDCTFTQATRYLGNALDSNDGARYVFRYNTVINDGAIWASPCDSHGYCETGHTHGTVYVEIYENTIIHNSGSWEESGFKFRGGSGVVFNNVAPAEWVFLIKLHMDRSSQAAYDNTRCYDKSDCGSVGNCIGDADNPTPPYCDMQITDFYIWGNKRSGASFNNVYINSFGGCVSTHLVSGRDYYNDGTQYPGYVQYTYPHPLRKPEPPQNLRIK